MQEWRLVAFKYAIFFCEFGSSFSRKTLTQVCVLMLFGASNIGQFANGIKATTKIPDLYAIIKKMITFVSGIIDLVKK